MVTNALARMLLLVSRMPIEQIMTTPPCNQARALAQRGIFVDYDDDITEALAIMTQQGLDSLPVVGPALELLGVVRYRDAAQISGNRGC
jgi:CBS domain-containing protein